LRAPSWAAGAAIVACVGWTSVADADPPPAASASESPPAAPLASAASSAPPPIVLVLDENGLHAAGDAPLGPRLRENAPKRGLTGARLGLPPLPRNDPRPPALEWEPGEVVPFGYVPKTYADRGLRNAGITVFSSSAGLSALVGLGLLIGGDDTAGGWALLVPVVGPVLAIGTLEADPFPGYILVLDALTQAAGVTLFALAWATPDDHLERLRRPSPRVGLDVGPGRAALEVSF
jgi:hypothetical protein